MHDADRRHRARHTVGIPAIVLPIAVLISYAAVDPGGAVISLVVFAVLGPVARRIVAALRTEPTLRPPVVVYIVIISLMVIGVSGALLFAADYDTLVYSRIFWIKMGLVAALAVNGGLLWRAERRAMTGDDSAWRTLRTTSIASITLWMLTTLGGVVLPNIG